MANSAGNGVPAPKTNGAGKLFRKKSIEASLGDSEDPSRHLRRDLSAWDLGIMGVAVAVGAGIFSLGADVAVNVAGPAVSLSFLIAAIVCGLAIMCYAEFASTVPVAGSAYTFSYATMGEIVGWIIGWDLLLEMMLAGSVVSKFWGAYLADAFKIMNVDIPTTIHIGSIAMDWGSFVIVGLFTILLMAGTKLSNRVNAVFTAIKLAVVALIIAVGVFHINTANYSPFIPPSEPAASKTAMHQTLFSFLSGATPTSYGMFGLMAASAIVFFAFIGFDVVATSAEEAKDPQRTLPRGILIGLVIVSVLYVAITLVVTGMANYADLGAYAEANGLKPTLTTAFQMLGLDWAGSIISIGALFGMTTVIMVVLYGGIRIAFTMSRDGLLPRGLSKTGGSKSTPRRLTLIMGLIMAFIAGFTQVQALEEMVNIGTLSAFVLVCFGIPILRKNRPDLARGFKVPGNPWLPILAGVLCLWLMANLTVMTWLRFLVWLAVGLAIYFGYGHWHSRLYLDEKAGRTPPPLPPDAAMGIVEATGAPNTADVFSYPDSDPPADGGTRD